MLAEPDQRKVISPLELLAKCRYDLTFAAAKTLTIRAKDGTMRPFLFNDAQVELDRQLTAQRARHGFVRALVLKGRQQGASTYVAARFYNRASMAKGVNVYILSHEQSASDTLFGIVDRYQRNNPLAPHVGTSNVKELEFDRLESSYTVATAGKKAAGRSKAISLLHGSEVAFWPNAAEHFAASVQGVPLAQGTEIILESTSNGAQGEFYERYQDAQAGRGDYIAIFLPWWLSPEYSRSVPPGFALSDLEIEGDMSEAEYAATFKLSLEQMAWRRGKISELRSPLLFRREYPATPAEAWTAPPGHEPFINHLSVLRARKRPKPTNPQGPLIIGVDPASNGGDRFSVAWRRGLFIPKVKYRQKIDIVEAVAWLSDIILTDKPARVNIDAGNIGAALITALKALSPEIAAIVRGIDFGGTSEAKLARPKVPGPANRRAEMWGRYRDWLELPEGAVLPDDDALQSDTTAPKIKPKLNNDYLLESKVDMRTRGVRSPDLADSVVLTFASREVFTGYTEAPVSVPAAVSALYEPQRGVGSNGSPAGISYGWMG